MAEENAAAEKPVMDNAEVVIVGGGIAGASLAYFLSRRGVTDIILLERESTLYTLAGGEPLGIIPKRRTIIVPPAPDWYTPSAWPHTTNLSHHFYIKPEGQSIIASPMDEDPLAPCDAKPGDFRVAEIAD